jgi:hypothetical protein
MGIRRTIIVLRCTAYCPSGQNVYPGGEPWHLVRAAYYSRYPNGEGKRGFTDRTKAPRVARTAVLKGNMRLSVGGSSRGALLLFTHTNRTCDIFSNPPHEGEHCKRTVR